MQAELAERLAALAPGDLNWVFFTTGGGEAVESAWKAAKQGGVQRGSRRSSSAISATCSDARMSASPRSTPSSRLILEIRSYKTALETCRLSAAADLLPGAWHKSELGLVKVELTTTEQVRQAAAEILDAGAASGLHLELLVAEMARGTLEVYVGYKRDPQFGPTLVLGLGGIWTEFLDVADVYVGLADDEIASRWIPETRVGHLLTRARGGALDISGIVAAVMAVSRIAHSYPDVVAVDISPMIVSRDRAVAVDAVIQRSAGNYHKEETS